MIETLKNKAVQFGKFVKSKLAPIAVGVGLILAPSSAHAADYADVAAAIDAVELIPSTVSPVFLAFVTLGVGVFTIRMLIKYARRGSV